MQERRDELEEEIVRCEAEITACQLELAHFKSSEESIRLARLIEHCRTRLDEMMKEWEQITRTLEKPGKDEPGKAVLSGQE